MDPGPGSLVRALRSRPKLNPSTLNAIFLTHKHIDHSNDINIMIEAMTSGGKHKKGIVFAPSDALKGEDPVILRYLRTYLEGIKILGEGKSYNLGELKFSTPLRHTHPVETYGVKFALPYGEVVFISDTAFSTELIKKYFPVDLLIINLVLNQPKVGVEHLTVKDAVELIQGLHPKKTIITHFGMSILREKPEIVAEQIANLTGSIVLAAYDGMSIHLPEFLLE